ncbi:hypothetical protein AAOE16_14455 [Ekhidna sp. MALMAid0563]|uniref:hypothetical protein n=1 Tax=Ekhidna sp. MALMAid0563 TaxID=3143937 RepID=UPI0032DEA3C8
MRGYITVLLCTLGLWLHSQTPIYNYVSFKKTLDVPEQLSSERSAVIFSVPEIREDFVKVGKHEKLLNQVHKAFITMGIDVIFYLHDINYTASNSAKQAYIELFNQRRVKNIIFITESDSGYELLMAPFSGDSRLIKDGNEAFFLTANDLYGLLLGVGKEVRRADQEKNNFLIPERPNVLSGLSIVENTLLKNYPGILRRSKLAVERFSLLDSTNISDVEALANVKKYNREVLAKNRELEEIMKSYPYDYELIDHMSDDDLKRNRYQFLFRSVRASASIVKQMLDYEVLPSETGFVSIIPIMPDQTRVKTIPRDAIVSKFYVRQNISKNVHVGEWDADVTWQEALTNMIGNLSQELNVKN